MTSENQKKKNYRIDLRPPGDREAKRNKEVRLLSVTLSAAIILLGPGIFLYYVVSSFMSVALGPFAGIIGFAIGVERLARLAPRRMFIYNQEWSAYVTQDILTGSMVPYGPGLHLSHWWEQRNREGNYSLKVITSDFAVNVVTNTALAKMKGVYAYAISLPFITTAIGVEPSRVESAISVLIESLLSETCADSTFETVRSGIAELNEVLSEEFMAARSDQSADLCDFESKYGFRIVSIVVESVALPAATQKTRDALDKASVIQTIVARLYGLDSLELAERLKTGAIPMTDYNKMLTRAMAMSENAKMDVNVIEADADVLLAAAATKLAKGGR